MCEACRKASAARDRAAAPQSPQSMGLGAAPPPPPAPPPAGPSTARIPSVKPPNAPAKPPPVRPDKTAVKTRSEKKEEAPDPSSPDVVIPLIFPDYLIGVDATKDIPEYGQSLIKWILPGSDPKRGKVAKLGHAGVFFFNGKKGTTKYYEFGRYDPQAVGLVKKQSIPDVVIKNGEPTPDSLAKALAKTSLLAAHSLQRMVGVYIVVPGMFQKMVEYCEKRKALNTDPKRKPYSLRAYNCMTFAKETAEAAGVKTPWEMVHVPSTYMDEFREDYRTFDWDPKTGLKLGEKKE